MQDQQELQKQQLLQTTLHLASLVSSAIQSSNIKSSDGKSVTAPSNGNNTEATIQSHETQVNLLTGEIRDLRTTINLRGITLKQLNAQLVNAFESNGVEVSKTAKELKLPPKP